MSDTVSSLVAVTEKKSHKPGSCTNALFQLFHWNRRFAKKKKMLTQAAAKPTSKKFGSDDKLPKFPLIADKNIVVPDSGQNHGMLTPGVVARLMGLDSMPAVQRDKLKKTSCSETARDLVQDNDCLSGKHAGNSEALSSKHELRPQKLQKTGSCGRYAVTGFGAEAAPFKSVLSRSKKHHQKFASPVKSSMSLSGRHASTLIDAATRILEPGLKSRNRAKFVLHDCSRRPRTLANTVKTEATKASADRLLEGAYFTDVSKSFGKGNNLLDIVNSRKTLVEQPSVSNYVNHSSKGLSRIRPRSPVPSFESEKKKVLQKNQEKFTAFAAQDMHNAPSYTEVISYEMPPQRDARTRWQLTSQQSKSQQDLNCFKSYNQKFPTQNQVSVVRDRMSARSKLSNLPRSNQSRYVVGLNQSSSDRAQRHLPTEADICEYDSERHTRDMADYCVPSVQERCLKVIRKGGGSGFVRSGNQMCTKSDAVIEKIVGGDVQSQVCIGNKFACELESNKSAGRFNMHNDVISFIFSSPIKQKVKIPEETSEMGDEVFSSNEITWHTSYEKKLLLTGDTLGTLVEEKLKELMTNHEMDELAFGSNSSERTSSIIIQELISALDSERPSYQNDLAVGPYGRNATSCSGHTPNVHLRFQPKPKRIRDLQSYSNDSNCGLSPISVLEVPISGGSGLFSSTDYTPVYKHHDGLMELSSIKPQQSEPYFDPAISLSKGRPGLELVRDILKHTSDLLCRVNNIGSKLEASKLDYAKEVILNAELLFRSSAQHDYDVDKGFSISRFLIDKLDALGSVLCASSSSFAKFNNKRTALQGFLFDCIIEYIDSRYGPWFKYDNKKPGNLLLCINAEMLIKEIVKEIISWKALASLIPDEHIEKEMSCCLGRCLEKELFETGAAIDEDIFQILVDEILIDFTQTELDSSY
ncbi:hypothetical protein POM88_039176 [Heracleum sosnowskyi]|uniref:DUF4378 domain-containing protein n=1 Tax=Heracleum sosnowskyi TaxID=360622 RepID=A0AAD8M666_9APIA|nr:hypothetical protein POM88_039176 [Heracleum sosnowskyi]